MKTLKELRTKKKSSQQDIADYLGVSRQAYNFYENEKREPDIETLSKLSKYFNVSIDYLIHGETTTKIEKKEIDTKNTEENEIEKMTDDYLNGLFSSETNTLMLNGEPASEEAINFLRAAIRSNVEYAKKINDEKNK